MHPRLSPSPQLLAGTVTAALALALTGCGSDSSTATTAAASKALPATLPISVIVPTTGPLATFGAQVVAGVEAGVSYIEDSGVLGQSRIEVKVEDTASQATNSASSTQKATRDGVVAVIGSPISNEALAAAPIANKAGVPFLATTAPGPHLPALGEYVYSMTTPQTVLLTSYVQRLVKDDPKVTVIYASDNDTTVNLNKAIAKTVPAAGGDLLASVSTTLTATDSRVVATKAMNGSPDAIGIMSGGTQLPALVSELRALGYKGRVFANAGADVSAPAAGKAVNGLEFQGQWAPDVDSQLSKDFAKHVTATSPDVTPHYPALDGFNSVRFIAQALAEAKSADGKALVAAMKTVAASGFASPGGAVTFTGPGGRQLESPAYDLVIQDGVVSVQK
ncbi:MAG: branched-chain amino acid transporter substrate-binding protein [Frankiales bacterium]|nr:branched-chain amino acid transporter substrate-binding protein [Frankiales bacterium]